MYLIVFDKWGFQEVYYPDDNRKEVENYSEKE